MGGYYRGLIWDYRVSYKCSGLRGFGVWGLGFRV